MKSTATIRRASAADWEIFLCLAAAEGWRVPVQEVEFFQRSPLSAAFVLVTDGQWCGFVTAAGHGDSGWIGNLLVPSAQRNLGWGGMLFEHACAALTAQGVKTLWLTASESGRPLYVKRGFLTVGGVTRWIRQGGEGDAEVYPDEEVGPQDWVDLLVWGESRRQLLDFLGKHGTWLFKGTTAALLQRRDTLQIIGPWVSLSAGRDEGSEILEQACRLTSPAAELIVDMLDGSAFAGLPRERGFVMGGYNLLMARGPVDVFALRRLVALASLGSFG